ncbi:MAG: hypothetical protein RMJ36_07225, partial [Candidatus Calescibacterium sp.]|nr:hypothetical protein [Candidatus Calescibacterium sp.]MDW8133426.1 hypothetical protein [Candidatus Calescibacterium sp.]
MMRKKGILLLTTLFFIVVLIMMSVALFGLTRSNYQVNRDYFAQQSSVNNAENAIQILMFLIQHNPNAFKISSGDVVFAPTLPKIEKILQNSDFNQNLPYYYIFYDMKTPGIVAHNYPSGLPNVSIDEKTDKQMFSIIFVPKNKNIADEGVVIFFGNNISGSNTL